MEGVVRRIWKTDPRCDICFVYTIGQWMLPALRAGRQEGFGAVMEEIANRYGIPTIDLGIEVAKREKAGELLFKADTAPEGKLLFSKDGVHPGDGGHDIYRDVIARSLLAMQGTAGDRPHALGEPLLPHPWENATLLPIAKAKLSAGWAPVEMATDPVVGLDRGRTRGMLRQAVKCDRAGESFSVRFRGTTVGISDIPTPEPIGLEATIDGTKRVAVSRKEGERKYARFWYVPELPFGEHTVTFTVKALPAGISFYEGQILVAGEPLP